MKAINIVLDETESQSPIFVDIETDEGKSINIGERSSLPSGFTNIRITIEDIKEKHEDD
jgi:hypothetical protein